MEEFHHRVTTAAERVAGNFEIIFVNDGSPDASLDVARALLEGDPRVRIIDLSRNFGHHKAIMTGLAHARGDLVFLIDADLEEPPELLPAFFKSLCENNVDVVYGVQARRSGNWWKRFSGTLFYRLFAILSSAPLSENLVTVRLMTQRYVRALVAHRDREIFLAGLWLITGFRQIAFPIAKGNKGSSSYTLSRQIAILVNAVTSFSNKPLIHIFYLGCFVLFVSSAAALYLVIQKLFFGTFLFGWPSLVVSIWMIGGLTLFCLGLIGIYLSKIFMETKDRPYTIIRDIYESRPRE